MAESPATNAPFCSNCGYTLTGLTESSKCPECGKPLVEVLTRPSFPRRGKRYQSKATIFGWPVISIALGPHDDDKLGHARGLIAIGDMATGGIALGGFARGIVAAGGFAIGVCAWGGGAVGLFTAMGGLAISTGIATGGGAIGTIATGGGAAGLIAQGGGAFGVYSRSGAGVSANSAPVFDRLNWLLGPWPPNGSIQSFAVVILPILCSMILAGIIGMIASIKLTQTPDNPSTPNSR